jgi:hypothetical protein
VLGGLALGRGVRRIATCVGFVDGRWDTRGCSGDGIYMVSVLYLFKSNPFFVEELEEYY